MDKQYIDSLIDEIFDESANGKVLIEDNAGENFFYYARFYNEQNKNGKYPCFEIHDKDLLEEKIAKYLLEARKFYAKSPETSIFEGRGLDKRLVLNMLLNASYFDMIMPEKFVDDRIKMLKTAPSVFEKTFFYAGIKATNQIKKLSSNYEAPYKFETTFEKNGEKYTLPAITFGLVDDKAKVFAVQNFAAKTNKETLLKKKLGRHLYKLNSGVCESDIIANVSVSAVAAATIFLEFLKEENINKIEAPTFLPLRYHTNKVAKFNRAKRTNESPKSVCARNNLDQFNMTNKFAYLFERLAFHFDNIDVCYDDNTMTTFAHILQKKATQKDNIAYDIAQSYSLEDTCKIEKICSPAMA